MVIQFFLSIVLLTTLWVTWRRMRQGVIGRKEAFLWSAMWILAGIVIWQPEVASTVARIIGVGRGADAAFYIAIILLFLLVFRLHISLDRLERTLTDLVRRDALRDLPTKSVEAGFPPSRE